VGVCIVVLVVDLPPDCEPFSGGGDTHPVEISTHTRNRLKNTTARLAINVYYVSFNKFGFDNYVSLSEGWAKKRRVSLNNQRMKKR
jgi:hypothetical protein